MPKISTVNTDVAHASIPMPNSSPATNGIENMVMVAAAAFMPMPPAAADVHSTRTWFSSENTPTLQIESQRLMNAATGTACARSSEKPTASTTRIEATIPGPR